MTEPATETQTEEPAVEEPAVTDEQPEPETGDVTEDEDLELEDPDEEVQFEEPEATAAFTFTELDGEKASKESEKYWKTAGPNILAKWGPYGQEYFFECPLCPTTHKGFIDQNILGQFPDATVNIVKRLLGIATEVEYEQDTDTRTCPKCSGHGKTKTGSLVATQATHTCATCSGYGFVPPPTRGATVSPPNGNPEHLELAAVPPPVEDFDTPDVDNWGEPRILPDGRENPNYGRQPRFKVLVDPWGQTAGLTAQDA